MKTLLLRSLFIVIDLASFKILVALGNSEVYALAVLVAAHGAAAVTDRIERNSQPSWKAEE